MLRPSAGASCRRSCAVICRWHGSCGVSGIWRSWKRRSCCSRFARQERCRDHAPGRPWPRKVTAPGCHGQKECPANSGVAVRSRPTRMDGDQKLLFGVRPAVAIARPLGRRSDCLRSRASHPALVAGVAAWVAEELSLLPDRGSEQPQARRQDREDRQPHHVAPMTAIDGDVRCGIQVPASCLETRTTEVAPAATPRRGPVRSRITVCQIVMDSSCRVVAPARGAGRAPFRHSTVAMTSVFTRATMIRLTPSSDLLPGPEDCDISDNGEQTETGTLPAVVDPQ
jgi:hypothetical protein